MGAVQPWTAYRSGNIVETKSFSCHHLSHLCSEHPQATCLGWEHVGICGKMWGDEGKMWALAIIHLVVSCSLIEEPFSDSFAVILR